MHGRGRTLLAGLVVLLSAACVEPVSVEVTPGEATLALEETLQLQATVSGDSKQLGVEWSVEGDTGATVDERGLFTAPAAEGAFTVVATARADKGERGRATIHVTRAAEASLSVTPRASLLALGRTLKLTAKVGGTSQTRVRWSVAEGEGSVDGDGLYTPPGREGSFTITATSVANPEKTATATVKVVPAPPTLSGTVSYAGPKQGRIYITARATTGWTVGTSIEAPGPFTIRGLRPDQRYSITAFLEPAGAELQGESFSSPRGTTSVSVAAADATGVIVTLTDPAPRPPTRPVLILFHGEGVVAVGAVGPVNADACLFYWGKSPNPGPGNAEAERRLAGGFGAVMFEDLPKDVPLYFSAKCVLGDQESELSPSAGPILVGPLSGETVSGTVKLAPEISGPLYVIAAPAALPTGPELRGYVVRVGGSAPERAFTLKVPAGKYQVVAVVDRDSNGQINLLDQLSLSPTPSLALIDVQSGSGATVAPLELREQRPRLVTGRYAKTATGSASLTLMLRVPPTKERATRVALRGPQIADVVDVPAYGEQWFQTFIDELELPVSVGDTYEAEIRYADGSERRVPLSITAILPAPVDLGPTTSTSLRPELTWSYEAALPPSARQTVTAYRTSGGGVWSSGILGADARQVVFNRDGTVPEASKGDEIRWTLQAIDDDENFSLASSTVKLE